MLRHHSHSKDGSDRSRRSSKQEESTLEKLRREAPRFGHKKEIEWDFIINPYKEIVRKNIAWVADRPSCADELLEFLQTGVNLMGKVKTYVEKYESVSKRLEESERKAEGDRGSGDHDSIHDSIQQAFDFAELDLKAMIVAVDAAYRDWKLDNGILYGFGRHALSNQTGPEGKWLKQFYRYVRKSLEDRQFDTVKEAAAAIEKARDVQKSMRDACHSKSKVASELDREIGELDKKMTAINNNNGDMAALHGLESELEQIDGKALQVKREVNSKQKELGEALGTPRRLWKEKHPVQDKKESNSRSKALVSKIKRISGHSNQSSTRSSESSVGGRS